MPGAKADGPIDLPKEELDKLRKVLRLSPGARVVILPDDGTAILATLGAREALPESQRPLQTEASVRITLAQALPKGDKLDEVIRAGTELGVAEFWLFASERTVVRWDAKKTEDRVHRLRTIAREAAEVAFRARLPKIEVLEGLAEVLRRAPDAQVLSEAEGLARPLSIPDSGAGTLVVGPEGGWSPAEMDRIGDRGVTLGPRVLRTEHAGPAAVARLLLG